MNTRRDPRPPRRGNAAKFASRRRAARCAPLRRRLARRTFDPAAPAESATTGGLPRVANAAPGGARRRRARLDADFRALRHLDGCPACAVWLAQRLGRVPDRATTPREAACGDGDAEGGIGARGGSRIAWPEVVVALGRAFRLASPDYESSLRAALGLVVHPAFAGVQQEMERLFAMRAMRRITRGGGRRARAIDAACEAALLDRLEARLRAILARPPRDARAATAAAAILSIVSRLRGDALDPTTWDAMRRSRFFFPSPPPLPISPRDRSGRERLREWARAVLLGERGRGRIPGQRRDVMRK
jgi:hypothetical protein